MNSSPAASPARCRQFNRTSLIIDTFDKIKMKKITIIFVLFLSSTFFIRFKSFCQSALVESVYFKPNSFSIDKKYEKILNQIARQLQSDTFGYLKIFAFADTNGSETYNEILSEKRADAIYNYLDSRVKIDTAHVYIASLGESADIYDLHFPEAHKQKRCVDIYIQFYRKPK
jgi:outer membrane protein OmpA-like peptidoglycan-associated protein